jgi:hypothetical protein
MERQMREKRGFASSVFKNVLYWLRIKNCEGYLPTDDNRARGKTDASPYAIRKPRYCKTSKTGNYDYNLCAGELLTPLSKKCGRLTQNEFEKR